VLFCGRAQVVGDDVAAQVAQQPSPVAGSRADLQSGPWSSRHSSAARVGDGVGVQDDQVIAPEFGDCPATLVNDGALV
jgi:hypothetical protein